MERSAESYLFELTHLAFPMKDPEAEEDTEQLPSFGRKRRIVRTFLFRPSLCIQWIYRQCSRPSRLETCFLSMPYKK